MTILPIDQALVMDTDDIPGRGGYAVVGLSADVRQAERVFVAQNLGISDFLHDRRNDRVFYSFFGIPNGRWAFVRRYPRGFRRGETQNRVFVHTLFIDETIFAALGGLPWILVESRFRDEGEEEFRPLTLGAAPPPENAVLPRLECLLPDGDPAEAAVERLAFRLSLVNKQLLEAGATQPGEAAVGAVIAALASNDRVLLPQGELFEQLTLLAWSMLPFSDRESLAWTQHDSSGISGVHFAVANTPQPASALAEDPSAYLVDITSDATDYQRTRDYTIPSRRVVALNTSSAKDYRDFHERARSYTIRDGELLEWLGYETALQKARSNVEESEETVRGLLSELMTAAGQDSRRRWEAPDEALDIVWDYIIRAITAGSNRLAVARQFGSMVKGFGGTRVLFRDPPRMEWLQRMAARAGLSAVTVFFMASTDAAAESVRARGVLFEWLLQAKHLQSVEIGGDVLMAVTSKAMEDRSAASRPLLRWLLESDSGLDALREWICARGDRLLLAEATAVALEQKERATRYAAAVLLPYVEQRPKDVADLGDLIGTAATYLRADAGAFMRLLAPLDSERVSRLAGRVLEWLENEPRTMRATASALLQQQGSRLPSAQQASLCFALAEGGETAGVWLPALLRMAEGTDRRGDSQGSERLATRIDRLTSSALDLRGAMDSVVSDLKRALAEDLALGICTRAALMLVRPVWRSSTEFLELLTAVMRRSPADQDTEPLFLAAVRSSREQGRDTTALIASFWQAVEARNVAMLREQTVTVIGDLDSSSRAALAKAWSSRIAALPNSVRSDQLVQALMQTAAGADARELRVQLARNKIAARTADIRTLNQLESDLRRKPRGQYDQWMKAEISKYAESSTRDEAVLRLFGLLEQKSANQTLKLFIETKALPELLTALSRRELNSLVERMTALALRNPLVPLLLANAVARAGSDLTRSKFIQRCKAARRHDAIIRLDTVQNQGDARKVKKHRIRQWFRREAEG